MVSLHGSASLGLSRSRTFLVPYGHDSCNSGFKKKMPRNRESDQLQNCVNQVLNKVKLQYLFTRLNTGRVYKSDVVCLSDRRSLATLPRNAEPNGRCRLSQARGCVVIMDSAGKTL
jgi:hypothetical protein